MILAYSGAKVQSRFYPGDLVTRTGDREICSVSNCPTRIEPVLNYGRPQLTGMSAG